MALSNEVTGEAAVVKHRSSLALLPGIVDRPRSTLAEIIASPRWRWVLPAVICLAALAILLATSASALSEQAQQQQAAALQRFGGQLQDMTEAQRAQMQAQMERFTSPLFLGITGGITGALGLAIGWLIGAAIIYFGLTIGGLDTRFAAIFAGFSWTWLPFALRDLVTAGWQVATGSLVVNRGLSYFASTGDPLADARNPLWLLLGVVDLFFLWHIVLVYCLIRAARPKGGALGLTLVYAILYVALRVLPGVLAGRLALGG